VHRHPVLAADGDQLVQRVPEPPILAADVAGVPAAGRGGGFRERKHFVRR
jgi:hypothetical protein